MAPLARTALLVGVGVAGASYLAPAFLKSRSYMSPIGINRDCTHTVVHAQHRRSGTDGVSVPAS